MAKEDKDKGSSYLPRSYGPRSKRKRRGGHRRGHQSQQAESNRRVDEDKPDKDPSANRKFAPPNGRNDKPEDRRAPLPDDDADALELDPAAAQALELEDESPHDLAPVEGPSMDQDSSAEAEAGEDTESIKINVVGVRFEYACKIYSFDSGDTNLDIDDWVVVKTDKGLVMGQVAKPSTVQGLTQRQADMLRKIIRRANTSDFDRLARCAAREAEAYRYCMDRIGELGLPMKLVRVECFFDGSKYVFFFTADGRVDFRELVKLLVARFPVRIEMRQIGVRHEAKMIGGLASCGQELCCSRFLSEFRPVSVKMAKNQNLSLNPSKISGGCGRLMCCLAYEHEIYDEFKKGLPKVGKMINSRKGPGICVKHNPLRETVSLQIEGDQVIEVRKEDIIVEPERRSGK